LFILIRLMDKYLRILNKLSFYFRKSRIHVSRAMLSNCNSSIDVRYWLTRPDKVKDSIPIYIVKKDTGEKFFLEKIIKYGETKTRHKVYNSMGALVFTNSNHALKSGEKVILCYGNLKTVIRII
jgi:hypothetical protein